MASFTINIYTTDGVETTYTYTYNGAVKKTLFATMTVEWVTSTNTVRFSWEATDGTTHSTTYNYPSTLTGFKTSTTGSNVIDVGTTSTVSILDESSSKQVCFLWEVHQAPNAPVGDGLGIGTLNIAKLYIGNVEPKIYFGNTLLYPQKTYKNKYDKKAVEIVNSISNLQVSWSGDNLNVTFDPITDTELLNYVSNDLTKVRLQLLYHKPSGGNAQREKKHLCVTKNVILYDNTQFPFPSEDTFVPKLQHEFARIQSHNPSFYGISWLNLNRTQLQNGSATLNSVKGDDDLGVATYTLSGNQASMGEFDGQTRRYNLQRLAVEMYVPALGKGTTDTFQYERDGNFTKSNIIYFTRN